MAYVNHLLTFIESNPALAVGFNLILLLLSGIFAHLLCKFLLIKVVRKVFFSSHKQDVPLEKDRRIAEKLSNFIPVIIVYYVLQFMPAMPASLVTAINTVCGILFFIFMSVFFNEMLDIVNSSYLRKTKRKNHSIKGYIQIGKILVHILAAIMILAVMSNKSPVIIISSLGAVAAVLAIIVFFAWPRLFPASVPGTVESPTAPVTPEPTLPTPTRPTSPTPTRPSTTLPPVRAVPALKALRTGRLR